VASRRRVDRRLILRGDPHTETALRALGLYGGHLARRFAFTRRTRGRGRWLLFLWVEISFTHAESRYLEVFNNNTATFCCFHGLAPAIGCVWSKSLIAFNEYLDRLNDLGFFIARDAASRFWVPQPPPNVPHDHVFAETATYDLGDEWKYSFPLGGRRADRNAMNTQA
jgi:hypothetical protein